MPVFATQRFHKTKKKYLSSYQQKQLDTFIERIQQKGQQGKCLGPTWLYEVKIQGKRVYYAYKDNVLLLLSASRKKRQQKYIDEI